MDNKNIFNINSCQQSGGITAGIVNLGSQPRILDDASAEQLKNNLSQSKRIRVTSVMGDQEAFNFAHQIVKFLKSSNFIVEGVDQAMYSQPMVGQFIQHKDNDSIEIIIGTQERQ